MSGRSSSVTWTGRVMLPRGIVLVLVVVLVLDLLGFCGEKGIRFPRNYFCSTALMMRRPRSRARARIRRLSPNSEVRLKGMTRNSVVPFTRLL